MDRLSLHASRASTSPGVAKAPTLPATKAGSQPDLMRSTTLRWVSWIEANVSSSMNSCFSARSGYPEIRPQTSGL